MSRQKEHGRVSTTGHQVVPMITPQGMLWAKTLSLEKEDA